MRRSATFGAAAVSVVAALVLTGCAATADEDHRPGADASRPAPSPPSQRTGAEARHGTLLVTDFGSDTVTFVDPDKGPVDSVKVGAAPYGLALGADGRAWVATADGVAVVDTHDRRLLARIAYRTPGLGPVTGGEYRGGGMGIALAPDSRHVYVGVNVPDGNGTLEIIDTTTLEVTDTTPVGRRPSTWMSPRTAVRR